MPPLAMLRWYHVGPHGYYDLVRLARRGRSNLVRVLYILVLFAALATVYYSEMDAYANRELWRDWDNFNAPLDTSINTNARIAERFCITTLVVQNLAVLILMPIYIATSIHEERTRGTLPILFTTHLTAREIVLGKGLSHIGHVGGILLGGLPILGLVQLWGGIDMPMILANAWNTGLWLVSVAALSLNFATQTRSHLSAIVHTYATLSCVFLCCCLPLEAVDAHVLLLRPVGHTNSYGYVYMTLLAGVATVAHLVLASLLIKRATLNLDALRAKEEAQPKPTDYEPDDPLRAPLPPVTEDALIWKERYQGRWPFLSDPRLQVPLIVSVLIFSIGDANPGIICRWLFIDFGIFILCMTVRMTGCIVREREGQTLDSLLTLPLSTNELFVAKVKGNLLRFRTLLLPFGFFFPILFLFGWDFSAIGTLLLIALVIHLAFFTALGMFLSVICRTVMSAYISLAIILMALVFGTWLLPRWLGLPETWFVKHSLNPVGCWISICQNTWVEAPRYGWFFPRNEKLWGDIGERFWSHAPGLAMYLAAAAALWALAAWRFRRNPSGV